MKRIIRAFRGQLDTSSTAFTAYKKWTKEVRERVVQETLFAPLLCSGFWSPVDETARRVFFFGVNDNPCGRGKGPYQDESCGVGSVGVVYPAPCLAARSLVVLIGRGSCIIEASKWKVPKR